MVVRFLVILFSLALCQADPVSIDNSWPGGFQGHFFIDNEEAMHGWKIRIVFDEPIDTLDIWNCEIEAHNATDWLIHSLFYDAELASDSHYRMGFVATVSGTPPTSAEYIIEATEYSTAEPPTTVTMEPPNTDETTDYSTTTTAGPPSSTDNPTTVPPVDTETTTMEPIEPSPATSTIE